MSWEIYEGYKNKHNLPDYGMLEHVFEISLENDKFCLREIRRQMVDKIKSQTEVLEDLIHPNSTVSAFRECLIFNDKQKTDIYDLYSRLMVLIRRSNILELRQEDHLDADFIREASETWPELQKDLLNIFENLKACWEEKESDNPVSNYFG